MVFSVLVVCVIALCMSLAGTPLRRRFVDTSFLFLSYYVLCVVPGNLLVAYQYNAPRAAIYPIFGVFAFGLGAFAVSSIVESRKRYVAFSVAFSPVRTVDYYTIVALIAVGIGSVILYYALMGTVPIFHGVENLLGQDSGVTMHEARRNTTYAHRGGSVDYFGQNYLRSLFGTVLPVATIMLIYDARSASKCLNMCKRILPVFVILVAFLGGQVWVGAQIVLLFALARLAKQALCSGKGTPITRVAVRHAAILFACVFAIVFLMRGMQETSGRNSSGPLISSVATRMFRSPTAKLYIVFPDDIPFRFGATWLNDLKGILPGPSEAFAYEVHEIVHGSGHGFTLTPTVFGGMYVNFGLTGLLFCSLLLGAILRVVSIRMYRIRDSVDFALWVLVTWKCALSATSDIAPLFVTFLIWLAFKTCFWMGNLMLGPIFQRGVVKDDHEKFHSNAVPASPTTNASDSLDAQR